jgi:hypothetical protein
MDSPKVHYHVNKSPPIISVLSHINPVHDLPFYCLKMYFNIIFPSKPMSSKLSLPSGYPTETLYALLLSSIRATYPAHFILLVIYQQNTHKLMPVC